jgi:predicted transcriptional regulator
MVDKDKKAPKKTGRMMAKTLFESETIVHDVESGKTLATKETREVRLPAEPPFIKMYIDDLSHFIGLKDRHKDVVFELLQKLDFQGMVTLAPRSRTVIAENLGISSQCFRNYLSEVVKTGLFERVSHNEFQVNPYYFAKGDWPSVYNRRKDFVMEIKYTEKGRQITGRAVDMEAKPLELVRNG